MAKGDKSDLGGEYEVNSHRAHLSAYVLIAGLVLELIASVIWFRGSETLVGMAAVILIVAGVWGEVFFGNKARTAGDKQLAQFEARAAEANQKAQEAALELTKFRTPRQLDREQIDRVANTLREFTGVQFAGARNPGNPEFERCLRDFEVTLQMAGWSQIGWHTSSGITRGPLPTIGVDTSAEEVEIGIPLRNLEAYQKPAIALVEALRAEGIGAKAAPMLNQNAVAIHVMVGPKR